MTGITAALVVVTFRIHRVLKLMFSQTFLGEDGPSSVHEAGTDRPGEGGPVTRDGDE